MSLHKIFKIQNLYTYMDLSIENKPREKSPWNVAGIIFLDSIFRCCTLSFHKNVKIREVKTVQKAQHPFFCRKNDVIDDVSQNLWHHFFYKNVMGPRTFYGAKLLISRSFEKNFGLTIFTSGVFRCSIPVKSWTKMQELILQSS